MFPSYRNQSYRNQSLTGFYMMGTLVVKGLNDKTHVQEFKCSRFSNQSLKSFHNVPPVFVKTFDVSSGKYLVKVTPKESPTSFPSLYW